MNVTYQLFHYDVSHRLLTKTIPIQSRSFVKAFLQLYYCLTSGLTLNIIDIDNTSRTIPANTSGMGPANLRMTHPGLDAGDDSDDWNGAFAGNTVFGPYSNVYADDCGIQVGTSATAVAVADDNLVAPVANGTSSGQMVYYGCWGLNYVTGASSASFDVERIVRNSSGGSIIIAEIGIYSIACNLSSNNTEANKFGFCILRDVLGATVTVLNGEYLKVKYTITVSN